MGGQIGRLTDRRVRAASPGKHHDGGGAGLALRVAPSGGRYWVQRIRVAGRRREIGLGAYPAVTLAEARRRALDNLRMARDGRDPVAEKRRAEAAARRLTFAEAVDAYLAHKLTEFRNEKHRRQWRSTLATYALPALGTRPVAEIGAGDVLRVLKPVWTERTETASRLRGRIEAVLTWATVAGHREGENPARWKGNLDQMLPRPSKVAKEGNHPALALADAPRWWAALGAREGMAARALQFLALTAARSGEVRGATWAEIDLGDAATPATAATSATRPAIWTIPAGRMKAGREHRVPLRDEAVALLRALPRVEGSEMVFPAARGGALSDMAISAVMRRMQEADVKAGGRGFPDPRSGRPAVPHGLRATFRQWAAERGYDRDMAEMQLAHDVGTAVERAYQRSDMLERRRAMMAAWARFLRGEEGGRVVALEGHKRAAPGGTAIEQP